VGDASTETSVGSGLWETTGASEVVSPDSVAARIRPKNRAITAMAAKLAAAMSQPWRRSPGRPAIVGWATNIVRMAMPSTPPSWRALEFTAAAVAYLPAGTVASPPLVATGKVAPTPMPLMTWPGSHWPRKSGWSPTRVVYQM
jgi:hypothetical protein